MSLSKGRWRRKLALLLLLHVKETKYELFLKFTAHIIITSKKSKYMKSQFQTSLHLTHEATRTKNTDPY